MKGLIYCKEHKRSFGFVHFASDPDRMLAIAVHLWATHNVPGEKWRELTRKIATGESDFPLSKEKVDS